MGISPADWLVAPMPAIDEERAVALLTERFGVEGTLEELGSNHDRTFRVRTGLKDQGYVFKVFNPVIDRAVLRAQSEATERLAQALPDAAATAGPRWSRREVHPDHLRGRPGLRLPVA